MNQVGKRFKMNNKIFMIFKFNNLKNYNKNKQVSYSPDGMHLMAWQLDPEQAYWIWMLMHGRGDRLRCGK